VTGRDSYDLEKQLGVVLEAVKSLGIAAEKSGRNDLTADGRKFSGNAYCFRKNSAYHHGTILVSTDMDKLSKYLQVSAEKMGPRGVKSVSSRVVNLCDLKPGLDVETAADALMDVFRNVYSSTAEVENCLRKCKESRTALEELYCKYSSWAWRYGNAPVCDLHIETRFPWGGVGMAFVLENGMVSKACVYSDAMDADYIQGIAAVLKGCRFSSEYLAERILSAAVPESSQVPSMAADIAHWLREKGF
jgi:lipoate-protein ligase A